MIWKKMGRSWLWAAAVVAIAAACAACKGAGEAGGGNQTVAAGNREAGDKAEGRDKDGEKPGGDLDGAGKENSQRDAGSGNGEGDGGEGRGPGNGVRDGGKDGEPGDGEKAGGKTGGSGEDLMTGPEAAGPADGERVTFTVGTWDGLTFTNPWLKVSIAFPQGSKVFSAAEMRALVGTSSEIMVNSGGQGDVQGEISQALNVYDLMVTLPDGKSSVQLAYMNAKKTAPDREISAADCLEEMAG